MVRKISPKTKTAKSMASKALSEVKKLKQLVEHKTQDVALDSQACTASWAVIGNDYLDIPQGDNVGNRDGLECKTTSLHLKGFVKASNVATGPTQCRLVMYWRPDSSSLALPLPMSTDTVESFKTLLAQPNTRILYDRIFVFSPQYSATAPGLSANAIIHFEKFVKFSHLLKYTSSAAASCTNGQLVAIIIAESATTPPVVNFRTRIRFQG